jgi:hypothetical protein
LGAARYTGTGIGTGWTVRNRHLSISCELKNYFSGWRNAGRESGRLNGSGTTFARADSSKKNHNTTQSCQSFFSVFNFKFLMNISLDVLKKKTNMPIIVYLSLSLPLFELPVNVID